VASAVWISLVAVLIALGSFTLSIRNDRRLTRAERTSRRARIIVESRSASDEAFEQVFPRAFYFDVRNVGAAPAHHVQLWLTNRGGDRKVSSDMASRDLTLVPDEPSVPGSVNLEEEEFEPDELDVWIAWTDDEGSHEERTDVRPI